MSVVINEYTLTTEDGVSEVQELDNGMTITTLIEKSDLYLQREEAEQVDRPVPEPTELELLQEDNASLWYESMIQSTRVEANETEVANLWYELMMGGI